ncbi:WD repeat 62 [Chlorella sorokiniana]|uniref:WD repeat 62 n=1 Tax=Chlorella sorokiniana TaxID=3076 RepID=A0A2P6TZI6_CHLSO|nr:WD repeat 62 [Chlorella sorokiniana]|eukprot:PRW59476.1 WD repeat 62 [Chlorella sorokiniana]
MAPPGRQPPALLPGVAAVGPATLLAATGGGVAVAAGASVSLLSPDGTCTLLPPSPDSAGKPIACLAAAGTFVAAGERGSKPGLHVWRLGADGAVAGEGAEIAHALHNFGIAALAFSPSGRLLASHGADKDWQLAIWSPASGRLLGKARMKGQQYDSLTMPSEATICGINRTTLAVWSLERGATTDGSLKLTCAARYNLTTLPAPVRFLGLWGVGGGGAGGARAALRLLACTDSGRLMRLRPAGNPVDTEASLGDGKVLAVAASPTHMAAACANGKILLFSAATLQPEVALELPEHLARNGPAVACSFAAGGAQLVASYKSAGGGGSLLTTWDISNMKQPALLGASLRACHSEGITDAISIPSSGNASLVVSCSLEGSLQLWKVGAGGVIAFSSSLDLRAALNSTTCKPLCLAASEDGRLLAVGDAAGCVHLFTLASPGAPAKLSTTHASDADITALGFGPCPADGSVPLLAVGSKRGSVRLLQLGGSAQWHRRASCSPSGAGTASSTALASITDHTGAVTGVGFTSGPDGLRLTTCGADGRQLTYSWDAEARQLRPAAQAAVPRASFAGLVPVQAGQAVVAATKGGRISWQDEAGQEAVLQILDKRQGELAAFGADNSLSVLAAATNRNTLHLYRLAVLGGKPTATAVGSCKAHIAGTAIAKVLILPDSGCVLTAGEDGSVCTHRLPATIAAMLLSRRPAPAPAAQQHAAPAPSAEAPAPSRSGGSSGLSSVVQPRALINDLPSPAAAAPAGPAPVALEGSGRLTTVMAPPASLPAQPPAAEAVVEAPAAAAAAGLPRTVSLPPSPNRAAVLAGISDLEEQYAELQAAVNRSFTAQRRTPQVPAARPPTAPPAAPSPQPTSPAAAAAAAAAGASPSLNWFAAQLDPSPLAAMSMGAHGQSPDVFADLESPAVAAASPAAAPAAHQQHSPAQPASVGSTGIGASISSKLSRLMRRGWAKSPAAGSSTKAAAERGAADGSESVGAALDAADAGRTAALLRMSATEGQEAGMAASPAAAFLSAAGTASATVDLADALGSHPGSVSVNQPRRRRGWGPPPGSAEQPRRSLSAMEGSYPGGMAGSDAAEAEEVAPRPHSVMGCEQQQQQQQQPSPDAFSVHQDASAQNTPPSEAQAAPSSSRSRRLSFSFGGGPCRAAACSDTKDEETPTMGAKLVPAPQPAAAFDPTSYTSPVLPPAQPAAAAESTPRLFGFGKPAPAAAPAAEAPAAPPLAPAAAAAEPGTEPLATTVAAAKHAQPSTAVPAAAAAPAPGVPKPCAGLQGRPAVPKLNLSSVGPHMAAGGAAAAPCPVPPAAGGAAAKRRRQPPAADPPEGLSVSTSSSAGSEGGSSPQSQPSPAGKAGAAGTAAQQAAEPEQGSSKKARPGMSPPRFVVDCGLFEPGSAEPQLKLSGGSSGSRRRRSSGAFWPVAAGGGMALSFETAIAEEDEAAAAQLEGSQHAAEEAEGDDPFSRPAAHDPLLDEEARPAAAGRPSAPPISTACEPASAFCSGAAEVPASGCCSPEPPSAPASGRAVSGATPFAGAAPSLGLAMELLQQGALMLSCLPQPLTERARAELAEIAASLAHMAAPDAPATVAPPPVAVFTSCDRENTHSNSNGAAGGSQAWPPGFDPVAFKAEILRELRQELHMGQ